jgi:pyruvate,water dikinase
MAQAKNPDILWFKDCSYKNKSMVGGKCSSLGELYHLSSALHFDIADGFAITTAFYDEFIINNNLESVIAAKLELIERQIVTAPDTDEFSEIEIIDTMSALLKDLIVTSQFTKHQRQVIIDNYRALCDKYAVTHLPVAVRSSAIAEDLPNASFAGQQDTFLNIADTETLLNSVKKCFASLFNSRAISYRRTHNIQLADIKISVAIQKMVRADLGSAGVAFSMDPETGYNKAIVINSAFGLGELVVSGGVKPDEYILDKRAIKSGFNPIISKTLGDKQSKMVYNGKHGVKEVDTTLKEKAMHSLYEDQVIMLGRHVSHIEEAYSNMFNAPIGVDVEWALDGLTNKLYILQTRPETVHSIKRASTLQITKYSLLEKGDLLISGVAVGDKISAGKIKVLRNMSEYKLFNPGDILVTDMTTPDWEPIMKIAAGIITNKGGRTCHAAIVARELGLTAIVGTSNATTVLQDVSTATLSCDTGETGHVFRGILKHKVDHIEVSRDLSLPVKLMLNVGNPESSFQNSLIPNSGVGLARIEFIINNYIKIHPLALFNHTQLTGELAASVRAIMGDELDGAAYFTQNLARGIGKIASAFYPNDVIVRLSDFKSNEYKNLIGGELYEPNEENPMIGWRGASRYYSADYEDAFGMECKAIKCVREQMGMDNVIVMIPFCRTPEECHRVLNTMAKYGLVRGVNGLQIYLMCEIPSNVIEADLFSPLVDGVSIGGNDLLQLTIGVDRDSEKIAFLSDDKNVSYRRMISMAIKTYHLNGVKVGFCGQQPSDSAEFCQFLIDQKIACRSRRIARLKRLKISGFNEVEQMYK